MTAAACRKLVVYTALVGPKEPLNNPLDRLPAGALADTDLDLDFVCFTDNPGLRSDVWRFEPLPTRHLPPEKLSRRPKAMPHAYFPDCAHSLYIDNTVSFKRLPNSADLHTQRPYLFRAFRHARHERLAQEVYAVAALGYEEAGVICQQMDFYAQCLPLSDITPLTTATVLLRSHHDPVVQRFGTVWWENVLAFAKRDQLAFDFALRQAGAEVDYLPGITRDNPFIHWQGSLAPSRLRASFDAKRYAWHHRREPEAVRDPKAHALAHERGAEPAYQRPAQILEVLCHQHRSSLGRQVSPRRGVAEALEPVLAPWRQMPCRFVLVRVQLPGHVKGAFAQAEFDAAAQALAHHLGPEATGTVVDLQPEDLTDLQRLYTAGQGPGHQLMLILGLPGDWLPAAVQKFARLLDPARASLAAVLTSPVKLADAATAETVAQTIAGRPVQGNLQASSHDDQPEPLANSFVSLTWS